LVVGYFEKLKNNYFNKDFIYINRDNQTDKFTDNNSGQSIENIANSEWKCTKITLADYSNYPYQKITIILNNSAGNQIAIELDSFNENFIVKDQYANYIESEKIKS